MYLASKLEQSVSTYIRKWLKLPGSTTNICFYSSISPTPLPIKSLTSILKSFKLSDHLLLRDSKDPLVSKCNTPIVSGQWVANSVATTAEQEIKFYKIRGPPQFGKAGLGTTPSKPTPEKGSYQYRKLVTSVAKTIDTEEDMAGALKLQLQSH